MTTLFSRIGKLNLNAIHTVHTVDEEDKDEDKGYLPRVSLALLAVRNRACHTFIPYCNLATIGLSEMKAKSFLLHVYGNGTMSNIKMVISATSRRNTYHDRKVSMLNVDLRCYTEYLGRDRSIDE